MKLTHLVLTEAEQHNDAMQHVISATLQLSVQSHLWHWQTKSYAAHEAFGEFYIKIRDLVDELAELFMGAEGEVSGIKVEAEMQDFDMDQVVEQLKKYKDECATVETQLMSDDNATYHGVGDKLLEITQAVDKLQYLLTLK